MQESPETPEEELEPEEALEPEPVEPPDPDKMYWGALPEDLIGDAMGSRIREYYDAHTRNGIVDLWRASHQAFYSLSESGSHEASKLIEFGAEGEMLGVRSNQLRSIIRYILTSATADRPAFAPKATNASASAMAQVSTARTLLDYYFKKKNMEQSAISVALRSLLYGQGYIWGTWDFAVGPKGPDGKALGDVVYRAMSPIDVVRDPERTAEDHDWYILRVWKNKYDQAAQFAGDNEERREELLDVCDMFEGERSLTSISFDRSVRKSDDVAQWHLLHAPTPSLPKGRYVIMTGKDTILFNGDLPFDTLHVYNMTPEEFLEAGSLGYGAVWELMGMQQVYDGMLSTAVTNFDAMGTNDILLPDGVNVGYEELREGLNIIRHPPGAPPAVLEKFQLADAFFKLFTAVRENMQLSTGVNNVVRGDPEASLKSGSALALVQAQAVHFQSGFQGAYVRLLENIATGTIQILKRYAEMPRLAAIAGAYESDALKAFKSDDINQIDRVDIEVGNPIFRTVAGKFDIATQLLERGLIKDPNQYYQVLETGRLEPVTDPARRAALRVREENELLMRGPAVTPTGKFDPISGMPLNSVEGCPVVITQDPAVHIAGHASVLDSSDALANPAVVSAVTEHILEHLRVWQSADPNLMTLLGYIPFGMPQDPNAAPEKGGDPAKGKNDQKSREASEKATGGNAPGDARPAKLPRPAQPPPGTE